MGTYYTNGATKDDIIKECLTASSSYSPLKHSVVGNNLWVALERKPDAPGTGPARVLALFLLKSSPDGWGYKPISESMGLYESDCPLYLLALVPEPEDSRYAADFRARVRAFHAQKKNARAAVQRIAIG